MKVLFTTNIPSPYRVNFFCELGKMCDLTVIFENKLAKNRDAEWMTYSFENFKAIFLKGIRKGNADALCPGILKYLSKKKFDVIVVGIYSTPTNMLAIEYLKLHKIPFILNSDGGFIKESYKSIYKIKRHFISAASAWLSTGDITTEYLCHYGADKDKVYKYPFTSVKTVDVLDYPVNKKEKQFFRDKLRMKEKRIILSVGQFIYRKGYDILLKSCRDLDKDIGIYLIGGKPTEEYLQLQKQYNLMNFHFVRFMKKSELTEYYKAADIFVLPTREDVWGLVVNEAMAYGLPVITTRSCIAGIEMIREGINGMIIDFEDADILIKTIYDAFNIDSRKVLDTARQYTIENMAKRYFEIFTYICKQNDCINKKI